MLELCARANARGSATYPKRWRVIKPRDVERWSQYGLLPDVDRPGRGRGKGRAPIYSDEFAERLIEIAALVRREHSQARAALALFTRGRPPHEQILRKAYLEELERLERSLDKAATRGHEGGASTAQGSRLPEKLTPEDRADLAEPAIAAHLRRLGVGDKTQRQATANLFTRVLFHGDVSETAVADVLVGLGVPDWLVMGGERNPDVSQLLEELSIEDLRAVVETSSIEDLERDLRTAKTLEEVVQVAQEHIPELTGSRAIDVVQQRSEVGVALGALNIGALRRGSRGTSP
jgi:hypothetical protein